MPRKNWRVSTCRKSSKAFRQKGIAIIEMLIAILVLSFLMMGVMDGMAKARRQASSLQNQTIAANISQEMMDAARNQTWQTLLSNLGTKTLDGQYINHDSGSLNGGLTYLPRPLVTDPANNTYSAHTYSGSGVGNMFRGTVRQTISQTDSTSLHLVITVTWPDEQGAGTRTLTQSTVITQNGIHNY